MEISKRDIAILDWLYQMDRETLGEDVCERGHHFYKGKYDFCPICGCNMSYIVQFYLNKIIGVSQKRSALFL